ncbi:MAG: transcription termination factor Rho [Opitutaceae bacterium]|nr:transcription termination factor Rho [Opitutaceae bacterium]
MEKASKARSAESKATKPKRPRAKAARAASPKTPRKRTKAVAATAELPLLPAEAVAPAAPTAPVQSAASDNVPSGRESLPNREVREVFVPEGYSRGNRSAEADQAVSEKSPEPERKEEPASSVAPNETAARVAPADAGAPAHSGSESASGSEGGSDNGNRQQPNFQNREFRGRDYWKQLKKEKRNKHGKPWQQNPNDRGPQNPAQPSPPSLAPKLGDLPDPARFADQAALDTLAAELSAGSGGETVFLDALYAMSLADLAAFARQAGAAVEGQQPRRVLLTEIFKAMTERKRPIRDKGFLDLTDKGHGFVVHPNVSYRLYPESTYVPESLVKRYGLKRGHALEVIVQAPVGEDRCPAAVGIERVMNGAPQDANNVTPFEELVPYYPLQRILLEAPEVQKDISMRTVDLLTPVGFGQRGLIVAPPRTGKTVLLQNIANSVSENFPDVKLILLLIDERPEEVTDFKRHTKGEVVSSTFDESPESHVHCAEMVGEIARRMVERGQHVVILLDSITRLARAYNALASNSGKIMSGGMEATALQRPKRFFGAARNIEGGGSLTILASALIDTGSRMDEVIFEEFKGTGNMELHLDRGLSDKRIFPAINMLRSGTRKEELIYHPDELQRVYGLRRTMQGIGPVESMEMLIQRLKKTKSNAEFLMSLAR